MPARDINHSIDHIDHIVVLMLENRSFDNVFGWLYEHSNNISPGGDEFWGLDGSETNPDSSGASIQVHKSTGESTPTVDPGEPFDHMQRQLFYSPADGSGSSGAAATTADPRCATNLGFVVDFEDVLAAAKHKILHGKITAEPADIMGCFTDDYVPALWQLASHYAITDTWFASVPAQTFPNRGFVHTAGSDGQINNLPHALYDAYTVFQRLDDLDDSAVSWKVYYDESGMASARFTLPQLWPHRYTPNFSHVSNLEADANGDDFASYVFIEPNLLGGEHSGHPPHSIVSADKYVWSVYNTLRQSKNWDSTLLIVTWDEHGGTFDHVPPPIDAAPPVPVASNPKPGKATNKKFAFDRFGARVGALLISPWVAPGSVFRAPGYPTSGPHPRCSTTTPFDHTSIAKTLQTRFGIEPLTARDVAAPCLSPYILPPTASKNLPQLTEPVWPTEAAPPAPTPSDLEIGLLTAVANLPADVATASPSTIAPNALVEPPTFSDSNAALAWLKAEVTKRWPQAD